MEQSTRDRENANGGFRNLVRRDSRVWGAVLLLVLGFATLDRAFAHWRNDGSNFRMANGQYWHPTDQEQRTTFFQRHAVLKTMAITGVTMILISIVLLGKTEEEQTVEGSVAGARY